MRVAIEALGIEHLGGGRAATLNLLRSLLTIDDQNEYFIYLSTPEPSLADLNPHAKQCIVPIRNRFLGRLWLQTLLPLQIRHQRVDLMHFAKNQVILGTGVRTIVTVSDLTTLRYPQVYPSIDVLYWRHILTRQLRRIHRLIALSQSTASDLVTLCQVPRERITVIYPGHDPAFHVVPQDQVCAARARFGLPERYLIHVGNISLKKNLGTLIEAFLDFRARHGFDGKLLLAGADYYKGHDERLEQLIAQPNVRDALVLPGYIPQDLLVALLNGACAFLFPSLHEGFGIAVLEAMACGVPVIAHAAGAVREVVGDAGVIIESSTDIHSWSCAIEHLVADPSLRARLRRDSLARAQLFSAEQCARQTLHLYKSLSVS